MTELIRVAFTIVYLAGAMVVGSGLMDHLWEVHASPLTAGVVMFIFAMVVFVAGCIISWAIFGDD